MLSILESIIDSISERERERKSIFFLSVSFGRFVFHGNGPFNLNYQVCGLTVVHSIPLLSF